MPARLILSLAAGLCLWLAFPGFDHWWLAPVGVAALALATTGAGARRGALLGMVAGMAYFTPLLSWSGIFVGNLPWIALSVLQALYVALLGLVLGWAGGVGPVRQVRVRPLVVALAWVASELARSTTPYGGFPWGRLGFSQADSPVLGIASVLGTPGVTFLVALSGGLLALGVQLLGTAHAPRAGLAGALAVLVAAATMTAPALIPRPVDGPTTQVLAVQGNVPQLGLDFNAQRRAVLDNHARGTSAAAALVRSGELPAPDLVLWPENSSDIDPLRNADAAEVITAAVEDIGVPVVVGAVLREPEDHSSNVSLLWLPEQGVVDRYVKQRPVPFAEYIPHRSFYRLFSPHVDRVSRDFYAGSEVGVLAVPTSAGELPLGVAICFEVVIDSLMRETVRAGAEILLVPTNNATFGLSHESVQQLAASRVKAVELGRSVIHVSTVGVSALITPDGQAHEVTELFTADLLSGALPVREQLTWAVRLGPWPEPLAVAALAVLVVMRARRGGPG